MAIGNLINLVMVYIDFFVPAKVAIIIVYIINNN